MNEQSSGDALIPYSFLETWMQMRADNREFFIKDRYNSFLIDEMGNLDSARRILERKSDDSGTEICTDGRFF